MDYIPRIADRVLKFRLSAKGAVLIEGPKWCGKTTTATVAANSVLRMDEPDRSRQYRDLAETAPSLLLKGDIPRLIDEWQLTPNLWNAVRYEVDQRGGVGQFILTGSAVPPHLDDATHSGTGRISRMQMRPMSLCESGDSGGEVSLQSLFAGDANTCSNNTKLEEVAAWISRGGWPQAVTLQDQDAALFQARDYVNAVVSLDINRVDAVERNQDKARRLLRSYARHCGTQATLETIRQDLVVNAKDTFAQKTLYSYIESLKRIFVIEDSPAWNPNLRSKVAIRTTDTRYFVDPSIAVAALGLGPQNLLDDLNLMGLLFENLCVRDLRIYSELLHGIVYHYRDKSGLECDAVVHLPDGSYGLIEIKLGGDSLIQQGAHSLKKLEQQINTSKMKSPAFLIVLCAVAPFAYRRPDGVWVVPISALGP